MDAFGVPILSEARSLQGAIQSVLCVVILKDLHHLSSPWLPTDIGTGQLPRQWEDCELELETHSNASLLLVFPAVASLQLPLSCSPFPMNITLVLTPESLPALTV